MDKRFSLAYDRAADVLYLNLTPGRKGYAEEVHSGIYARYDAKNHELIGVTILNFSKKFRKRAKGIQVPARVESTLDRGKP